MHWRISRNGWGMPTLQLRGCRTAGSARCQRSGGGGKKVAWATPVGVALALPPLPPEQQAHGQPHRDRSTPPVADDSPPPATAEQVDVRAHVRERIARGLDAIHPRDGVEDDAPPVR